MNSKILILLILMSLIGLGGAGVFVYKNKEETPLIPLIKEEAKPAIKESFNVVQGKETLLVKDDFTITLPVGWQEVTDFPEVLVMAIDAREEITNEKAKNIDFKTNFSIKSDDIGKYSKLHGAQEYIESVKTSLVQLIPSIEFTHEEQGIIDGNNAFFIECESTQEGINFKTLLVFIEGSNNIIWVISFNTFQNSWLTYRDLFYQIAESFRLKYKLEL